MLPISSMKMMLGWHCLAAVKRLLTSFSPSPTNLLVRLLALMLKKALSDSQATARASIVLPLPGGPKSSSPRVGVRSPVNNSGLNNVTFRSLTDSNKFYRFKVEVDSDAFESFLISILNNFSTTFSMLTIKCKQYMLQQTTITHNIKQ